MSTQLTDFDRLKAEVAVFLAPISTITVTNAASNAVAAGTLRTIKEMQKQIEGKRVAAVKPLNDQVKAVNEYAKEINAPLDAAEKHIKTVMGEFANAEFERSQIEQRKIDAARKEAEDKAKAENDRIAAEAEAKRKDEEKRLADAQAVERKRLLEKQKKEAAAAKMFGVDPEQQKQEAEVQRRALADKAEGERVAAAKRREEERLEAQAKLEREQREREAALKQQEHNLEADRVKNVKKVAKWRVVDHSLLPDEFWHVNEPLLGAAIRGGRRDIPGVEIRMETVVVAR